MRALLPILVLLGGCVRPGGDVLSARPELAPGATTWDGWRRGQEGRAPEKAPESLDQILTQALERSPGVVAARRELEAAVAEVGGAGLPPRPMVGYTWLPLPVETRVGANEHRVMVEQRVPSIPALVAEHDAAMSRAERARFAYERAGLEVVTDVKGLVAEVHYLQRALALIAASEQLAGQLVDAGRARQDAGEATLFDVAKAETQLAQLGYDRVRFEELLAAAEGRLNALLDLPVDHAWPPLASWPIRGVPPTVEPLYERALARAPSVGEVDAGIEADMAAVRGAWGGLFPDLTVGLQYLVNGEARMPGVQGSGEDALGVTVGISLPLWFGAERARIGAAEARLEAALARKERHVGGLLADVKEAWLRARNAQRLVALYDQTLLPEARRAMEDAESARQAGAATFTDLLEARNTLHRYGLARERAVADAVQAEARLERLTGGPLAGEGER